MNTQSAIDAMNQATAAQVALNTASTANQTIQTASRTVAENEQATNKASQEIAGAAATALASAGADLKGIARG